MPVGAPDLDALDYDVDLASREGVSLDYISRIRVEYLLGQNGALQSQVRFADAKAGILLAITTLIAGFAAPDLVQALARGGATAWSAALTAVLAAAVGAACLLALLPRFSGADERRDRTRGDRFSWPALATPDFSAQDYARFMRTAEVSQLVYSIAQSNASVSRIVLRKFQLNRVAYALALADLAAGFAHLALSAWASAPAPGMGGTLPLR